jgi:Gpi18-like mannosyltransferase
MVSVYLNAKLWLKQLHPLFPAVIAVISLFLPTVLINGSLWGQIDASYTAFSLIALYYLQKNKPFVSSLWYGLAISFKLQAIFFLPVFLIFFWFNKPYLKAFAVKFIDAYFLFCLHLFCCQNSTCKFAKNNYSILFYWSKFSTVFSWMSFGGFCRLL